MADRKNTISIRIKLFTGLDHDAGLDDYDPSRGLTMRIPEGTKLAKIIINLGLPERGSLIFFCSGEKIDGRRKLKDGDEISCFRPTGGG